MVLAFSLDIFSSHGSICFISGQDPVLFVKEDRFSQIPGKERKLPLASPISSVSSPSEHPPPPANGASSMCSGAIPLQSKGESYSFSVHPSQCERRPPLPHGS